MNKLIRKIIIVLSVLFFIANPCFAAVYWVDSSTGDDGDNGTTMDLAYATVEAIIEADVVSAGDYIFVRNGHSEVPTSDIVNDYVQGTNPSPITIAGWPRPAIPNTTITQADITNGSRLIDNVVGITPTREKHIGRFATLPDGYQYLITAVLYESGVDGMAGGAEFTAESSATNTTQTKQGKIWAFTDDEDTTGTIQYARDSASAWVEDDNITDGGGGDAEIDAGGETAVGFLIDRPYAGSTVTGANGKFQIEADELWADDMGTEYGFDDSGWTIKESTWDADTIDMPLIDFNDGAFQWHQVRSNRWIISGFEFKDSTDDKGILHAQTSSTHLSLIGCLFKQTTSNTYLLRSYDCSLYLDRCILEGSGSGSSQYGVYTYYPFYMRNSAILNVGGYGIYPFSTANNYAYNVNFGIEISNNDSDIYMYRVGFLAGRDIALGGENGFVEFAGNGVYHYVTSSTSVRMVNYQKELGTYYEYFLDGTIEKVAVTDTNANKKLSDNVIKITPGTSSGNIDSKPIEWKPKVFESRKTYAAGTYNVKLWIYNDTGNTLNDTTFSDDILMRCRAEAGNYGDATTEYVSMPWTYSDEIDIADAADADDWDYLQCDSVVVDQTSKIYCEVLISTYDAQADVILIDPQTVNP